MCGRFVLLTDLHVINESFNIQNVACEHRPGNNISPGQQIAAVLRKDDQNVLVSFRWGLIPSWAKDPSIGNKMFNARAETVAGKASFKNAFKSRRCLIVADGFYEWQKIDRIRKPLYFSLQSNEPFGFAGLFETWIAPDHKQINTCTIITTEPNELIRPIHERMPVILSKEKEAIWIDQSIEDADRLLSILKPYPSEEMKMTEVMGSLR